MNMSVYTAIDIFEKMSTSILSSTFANGITAEKKKLKIDTNAFKAHSIRAASRTEAVQAGHFFRSIK
jgi:hypothetical protein